MPSNDSLNTFQYGLYWELQQSKLYTYRGFPQYNYYRALSCVLLSRCIFLYVEIFIIYNLKIHYK